MSSGQWINYIDSLDLEGFESGDFEFSGNPFNWDNLPENETNCYNENKGNPVFGAVMIALVVIGLVGNSLVLFTILILREYEKSVTNWYILQLTLADTLFLLMLPFTAQSVIVGYWQFGDGLCKFKEALIFINYYASIYFLVVMSFDRYLAVTRAFASNYWVTTLRSPLSSYIISLIGWILSALLCIQLYNYSQVDDCDICKYTFPKTIDLDVLRELGNETRNLANSPSEEDGTQQFPQDYTNWLIEQGKSANDTEDGYKCKLPDSSELRVWLYGNFAGAYVLPLILICYFYGMIMKTITAASSIGDNERQKSYRRRVTLIVLALVSLFGISWLPWYVEKLIKINGIDLSEENCRMFNDAVRGIAYLNSAFNPYFYSFLGFHFRERLRRAGGQVRLLTSLRSSRTITTSLRKKRIHSSSNSAGSVRPNPAAQQTGFHKNGNGVKGGRQETPRGSIAQKTERTVV